ncbi:hypothetical protein PGB90_002208 [Kerria lacca]
MVWNRKTSSITMRQFYLYSLIRSCPFAVNELTNRNCRSYASELIKKKQKNGVCSEI